MSLGGNGSTLHLRSGDTLCSAVLPCVMEYAVIYYEDGFNNQLA